MHSTWPQLHKINNRFFVNCCSRKKTRKMKRLTCFFEDLVFFFLSQGFIPRRQAVITPQVVKLLHTFPFWGHSLYYFTRTNQKKSLNFLLKPIPQAQNHQMGSQLSQQHQTTIHHKHTAIQHCHKSQLFPIYPYRTLPTPLNPSPTFI